MIPLNRSTARRVVCGVDWGFVHPGVIEVFALDGDARMYRVWEVYQSGKTIDWWVERAKEIKQAYGPVEAFVCDPSEPAYITAFQAAGLAAIPAFNSIPPGIQAVQQRLKAPADGRPRLFFLRDERFSRDAAQVEKKLPTCVEEEMDSYCLVAGTLIETETGRKPIEAIRAGQQVWTRAGLCRVLSAGRTRESAKIWTAHFSDGARLSGTGEHPVWVNGKGWIALSSISSIDIIETWNMKRSSLMGSSTAAIPSQNGGLTVGTIAPSQRDGGREPIDSMSIFGSPFMGLSPMVTSSTTMTAILSTMPSRTWSASLKRSMFSVIAAIQYVARRNGWRSWIEREKRRRLFNALMNHECRRQNALWDNGENDSLLSELVNSAAAPSLLATSAPPGFAPGHATPPIALRIDPITRRGSVPNAEQILRRIAGARSGTAPVYVLSVEEESERAAVYNLTVEGCPEFYANGVLVHNCWPTPKPSLRNTDEVPVKESDDGLDALRYACCYVDSVGMNRYRPACPPGPVFEPKQWW